MKLLGGAKSKITKNENGENVPDFEITEVVLVICSIANNNFQQDSTVLHALVLNKSFDQLLYISTTNIKFFKTFNSEFLYIEMWFTDQNLKPLEM